MKSNIHNNLPLLVYSTFFYVAGLILANSLTFINFPILARGLSTSEFGTLDLFINISNLLTILLAFGIDSAVGRYFHEYKDIKEKKEVIMEGLLIQVIIVVVIGSVLYLMAGYLISYVSDESGLLNLLKLSIVLAIFQAPLNFALSLLKWTLHKWDFIFLSVTSAALGLGFTSIAIYGLNAGLNQVFEFILCGKALSAIIGLYLIRKWIYFKMPNFIFIRKLMSYAAPIGIVCVIEVMIPAIERKSILEIVSTEQLGLYAAAAKLVSILAVLILAFQTAWGPISLSISKQEKVNETYIIIAKIFVLMLCISALFMACFSKQALNILVSERYKEAYVLVFPIAMSLSIQSIGLVTGMGIYISKQTKYQLLCYLLFAVTSVVLIYYMTNRLGIIGTSIAILLASIFKTIIVSILSHHLYPINWPYKVIISVLSYSLIIGIILIILQEHHGILITSAYIFTSAIALSYLFWIIALSSYERMECSKLMKEAYEAICGRKNGTKFKG